MQKQITSLQTSLGTLRTEINNLSPLADDGTADALVGTWTGFANAIEFDRATALGAPLGSGQQFFNIFAGAPPGVTLGPGPSFPVPLLGGCTNGAPGLCQNGAMMVGVNPEFWLARSGTPDPIAFTISRDGMNLSGTVTQQGQQVATLRGIVLQNGLFLLRALATATGNCAGTNNVVVLQGTGSLSMDRARMTFTGSGVLGDCSFTTFRVGVAKSL